MVKRLLYFIICCFLYLGNGFAQDKDSIEYIGLIIAEEMPVFKGNLIEFIQKNIQYPESAISDSLQGKVIVSFWIDTIGFTIDHQVIKGIRLDLNSEALRIAKLIKYKKPAMQHGKPIKVNYTIPIEFKLTDEKKTKRTALEK